jgi:hypothetical protein
MRRLARSALALAFASFALTGCFKYAIVSGSGGNLEGNAKTAWENHFLWGLVGDPSVDVSKVCGTENATVRVERDFLQGLLSTVLLGLWTPSTLRVYCGSTDRPSAMIELSPEDQRALVSSAGFLDMVLDVAPELYDDAEQAQAQARTF